MSQEVTNLFNANAPTPSFEALRISIASPERYKQRDRRETQKW